MSASSYPSSSLRLWELSCCSSLQQSPSCNQWQQQSWILTAEISWHWLTLGSSAGTGLLFQLSSFLTSCCRISEPAFPISSDGETQMYLVWLSTSQLLVVCSPSIQMWALKTIVTILGEIISDYHKLQGILLLLINVSLLWIVVRNVPYYNAAINCFQGALYTLLTWQALILFALVWDDSWAEVRCPPLAQYVS